MLGKQRGFYYIICDVSKYIMILEQLRSIERLYKNCDQLVDSDRFGKGLWPVDQVIGQILCSLIKSYGLKRGIEVGAGVGYSTAWLASGFQETGGLLTSLEYFLPKVEQWEKHMTQLFGGGYGDFVEMVPSDLRKWIDGAGRQKFDFVFFDQRKGDYLEHLKLILPKLKKGAFICADNVISHADACSDYLDFVRGDERFESVCVELGAGLEITRYL